MAKIIKAQNVPGEHRKRMQEIAETQFGTLSDDEVLRFLAERKHLSDLERAYEKMQKEEEIRLDQERKKEENLKVAEKKKITIVKKIEELNTSITPDKQDDDLLAIVAQRREFEQELEALDGGSTEKKEGIMPDFIPPSKAALDNRSEKELPRVEIQADTPRKEKEFLGDGRQETVTEVAQEEIKVAGEKDFGNEKIVDDGVEEGSRFSRYFDQLKNNSGSLGALLQAMPLDAKKNKAFMLKVAAIDPAYAMHYADGETLKRDEDFNLRIASLSNPRNSGNALAEMLPEARTSRVLLAAVKQDYRNVRFAQPTMADYDEMMGIAKRGALEQVQELKEAADIMLLIPKPLQQDKQFMLQVKEIIGSKPGG